VDDLVEMSLVELPGMIWVQLEGELDIMGASAVEGFVAGIASAEHHLVLDARGLRFCDLLGLRSLGAALERWAELGSPASCLLSPPVERMASLAGAGQLLCRLEDAEVLAHRTSGLVGAGGAVVPAEGTDHRDAGVWRARLTVVVVEADEVRRRSEAVLAQAAELRATAEALGGHRRLIVQRARRSVADSKEARARRRLSRVR
jgi:anti-anti-sigma regulatory factor